MMAIVNQCLCLDADGKSVRLGDKMVWRNPYNRNQPEDEQDPPEHFTVRGLYSEGHDGDVFLLDEDGNGHYLGWCHKEE